jgi:hypothetical protein
MREREREFRCTHSAKMTGSGRQYSTAADLESLGRGLDEGGERMAVEFKVTVQDTPGTLARLGMLLGDAHVNIEAIQGTSREGKGSIQFVPKEADKATLALDTAGIAYSKRDVVVVRVLDEPGMLGDLALVMAKAGINIDSVYVTTKGHIVLGVDDVAGAIQIAGGMAVMAFE